MMKSINDYKKNKRFSKDQIEEIRKGLEAGLDVEIYANFKYTVAEMKEAKNWLLKNRNKY